MCYFKAFASKHSEKTPIRQYHTSSSLLEVSESESLGMVVLFCASDWDSDFESDAELVRRRLASARNP